MYVSNSGLRSVSVVDTVAMKVVKVIPVGEVPKRNGTLVIPDGAGRATKLAPGKQAAR
jgi:YVTN family beta-propeller protein